jgi:MinD-like ATPase involved in chromosome partitioning or flagellar assembly
VREKTVPEKTVPEAKAHESKTADTTASAAPRRKPAVRRASTPVTTAGTSAVTPEPATDESVSTVVPDERPTAAARVEGDEPRLTLASPAIVVDLPPAEHQEVPADELAVAIEEAPVTPEELEPRTNSVAVVAEPERPTERDEAIEEPPSTPAFTGMSVARALAGAPESSAMLTAERLLDDRRDTRRVPEGFWQKLLYDVSGHRIRVADSRAARERDALTARIAKPLAGSARFVPVLTRKGGVGKTTVTTLLGMALADARDDRVIAIDANPDRGTLAERITRRSDHTVRDLVRGADAVTGYTEFSRLVSRDSTRLDVLASDTDPHLSQAFDEDDYDVVARLASQYYSIVLTDCGTGIVHSVMGATLRHADSLVIVSGTSVDEARSAAETVSWLEANGYPELASGAVVVINSTAPGTPAVRLDEIEKHFESRVRSIVRIPFDPQLATGAAISYADLRPETRQAARELSALVVEGLPARRVVREPADG